MEGGERFLIEDDGFPNLLLNAMRAGSLLNSIPLFAWAFPGDLHRGLDEHNPLAQVMVWLGAGVDHGLGKLILKRPWYLPWKRHLKLEWDASASAPLVEAILSVHAGFHNRPTVSCTFRCFGVGSGR